MEAEVEVEDAPASSASPRAAASSAAAPPPSAAAPSSVSPAVTSTSVAASTTSSVKTEKMEVDAAGPELFPLPGNRLVADNRPSVENRLITDWKPRRVENLYTRERHIGEGTYGSVYVYRGGDGTQKALKQIKMKQESEGFPITAIREIKVLRNLHHKNIVRLEDVVASANGNIYMVFEYLDHDITGLLDSDEPRTRFTAAQIKYYFMCILEALHACHKANILHRDIKGANVLIGNNGDVKLGDFGLARQTQLQTKPPPGQQHQLTKRVVTLWYRAPELLLGDTTYDEKIDIWAAGCLFAELLTGKALFPGRDEPHQLTLIYEVCGSIDEADWPEVKDLSLYKTFKAMQPYQRKLRQMFRKNCTSQAVDLLDKLLTLNPKKRLTAALALEHDYFWMEPPEPMKPADHPHYDGHYYEAVVKRKREQKRRDEEHERKVRARLAAGPQMVPAYGAGFLEPGQPVALVPVAASQWRMGMPYQAPPGASRSRGGHHHSGPQHGGGHHRQSRGGGHGGQGGHGGHGGHSRTQPQAPDHSGAHG